MKDFYNNVFYKSDIWDIGGIETFLWSIGEKYGDRDIVLIYKNCHDNAQLQRLRKVIRVRKFDEKRSTSTANGPSSSGMRILSTRWMPRNTS